VESFNHKAVATYSPVACFNRKAIATCSPGRGPGAGIPRGVEVLTLRLPWVSIVEIQPQRGCVSICETLAIIWRNRFAVGDRFKKTSLPV